MNCGGTSENELEKALRRSSFCLLNSWFSSSGTNVFDFWIQKFSVGIKRSIFRALTLTDLLILIKLAYVVKLSPVSWKYLHDKIACGCLHHFYGYLICP